MPSLSIYDPCILNPPPVKPFSLVNSSIGPPSEPTALVGPVIDTEAATTIGDAIARGKADCTVLAEGMSFEPHTGENNYIAPIVFSDVPRDHMLFRDEFFGPVVAVTTAASFEEALEAALDSDYALTGAVFSRSPKNIERAYRKFRVGNLYINRGSTGALVMRQPFGGFAMSGVGSKAGGPDYLHQFVIPRAVSENTMRRGFAPELTS